MNDCSLTRPTPLEALERLAPLVGRPFGEILTAQKIASLRACHTRAASLNKGAIGTLLESVLDLPTSSKLLDLDGGELKTHKTAPDGSPRQTVAVTTALEIARMIEDPGFWPVSAARKKLHHVVLVSVVRDGDIATWRMLGLRYLNLDDPSCATITERLERDHDSICESMAAAYVAGRRFSTRHDTPAPGRLLQVRSKDTKPYHPVTYQDHMLYRNGLALYLTREALSLVPAWKT